MDDSGEAKPSDRLPELFHINQELGAVQKPGSIDGKFRVQFRLFFAKALLPGKNFDPQITSIHVSFAIQPEDGPAVFAFDGTNSLTKSSEAVGDFWTLLSGTDLDPGFYVYQYEVKFTDGSTRQVADPCARYSGRESQSSAFVLGGATPIQISPLLGGRKPLSDLVVYELHAGDFTAQYRRARAPFDAIVDKLDYLRDDLGVNAILILPWTAFVNKEYDWGYSPFQYFAVEYNYTNDLTEPSEKISKLKNLISKCHEKGIHVIMDGVFNHCDPSFAYKALYLNNANCPYTQAPFGGTFAGLQDLDFNNNATQDFIRDVCLYWISVFKIDGIRFDNTTNYYVPSDTIHGIPELLESISQYCSAPAQSITNFSLTLEHIDPSAPTVVNNTQATSYWENNLYYQVNDHLLNSNLSPSYLTALNSTSQVNSPKVSTLYLTNHDHASVAWTAGQSTLSGANAWYRTQPHLIALLTAPGTPLISMGQESGDDYWIPEDDHGSGRRVRPRPLLWKDNDPYKADLLPKYNLLLRLRERSGALRSRNFHPPHWEGWMTQLDSNGFGVDTARKLIIYHRWSDDGSELVYVALNFGDTDQTLVMRFARDGLYQDVLNVDGKTGQVATLNVAGNRAVVKVESNWGHVFRLGGA